ncbi:transposase [Roseimaritima multifibrata]|uniref:transposase n=1 Tax=Roseimaritima multifibrata TaxID=1930274 RepID=UPI001C54C162
METLYLKPGEPGQSGVCKSFNGWLRDEYLSQTDLMNEDDAPNKITNLACGLQH